MPQYTNGNGNHKGPTREPGKIKPKKKEIIVKPKKTKREKPTVTATEPNRLWSLRHNLLEISYYRNVFLSLYVHLKVHH